MKGITHFFRRGKAMLLVFRTAIGALAGDRMDTCHEEKMAGK
jgi:hypothetical protein